MCACIIVHNMIINDERECLFDESYHTVTFIIAPSVNYKAIASLTSILYRESHMTSGTDVFAPSNGFDRTCV
jgi:hypothetical protein